MTALYDILAGIECDEEVKFSRSLIGFHIKLLKGDPEEEHLELIRTLSPKAMEQASLDLIAFELERGLEVLRSDDRTASRDLG